MFSNQRTFGVETNVALISISLKSIGVLYHKVGFELRIWIKCNSVTM